MEIAGKGLAACLAAAFLYCALFRDGRPAAGGKEYGCFAAPPQAENHGRQDSLFLGDRKRGERKTGEGQPFWLLLWRLAF